MPVPRQLPPTAILHLKGIGSGEARGPNMFDGSRVIIFQFENALSGELLPPMGLTFPEISKLVAWLGHAVNQEVQRAREVSL
jgi:hypothetical protein